MTPNLSHCNATDLAQFISSSPISDTHEHLVSEEAYIQKPPDVLFDLFSNYVTADLVVAGAAQSAVDHLLNSSNSDTQSRFGPIRFAWECCKHTGYGEAVRIIALSIYGMEEITTESVEAAQVSALSLRQPGMRREMLQKAGIDHVQVDNFNWTCIPDASGPDFFLYDLSWNSFCSGEIYSQAVHEEVGIEVKNLETLRTAMSAIFAKYGSCAIAVKSQHAYQRTLRWEERDEADVSRVLCKILGNKDVVEDERCVLGDWCLARGVEFAIEHNLPFKIHTGYYAGHSNMPTDRVRSSHLWKLLKRYPKARFVLMHTAYPYSSELIALAKHYPNVWVDLCWAWAINPFAATDFVRRFIHAVPSNKIFVFGGDSFWPGSSVAYSIQARQGLLKALEEEMVDQSLTQDQALRLAEMFMQLNQKECFDFKGTRSSIHEAMRTKTSSGLPHKS